MIVGEQHSNLGHMLTWSSARNHRNSNPGWRSAYCHFWQYQPNRTGRWISCAKALSNHRSEVHDLGHHAITELAECQASDQTITSVAGHVSPRMLAHYSHVCLEAKRSALESISGSRSKWKSEGGQTKVTTQIPLGSAILSASA